MCTMTGKRNRNVRNKVEFPCDCDIDKLSSCYFGEHVASRNNESARLFQRRYSHYEGLEIAVENTSFDKSTSSSLSWGEDCEKEATQQVWHQYQQMQNVLKGLESIPPNYDKDEYKLWIKTFPSLRSSIQSTDNNGRKRSYPTTPISSRLCDKINTCKTSTQSSMIGNLINQLCTKLSHSGVEQKIENTSRKLPEVNNRNRNVKNENRSLEMLAKDFQAMLRISPAPILNKSVSFERRKSSKSYLNCDTEDYSSLPCLTPKIDLKAKSVATMKRRKRNVKNHLVLPPIDVTFNQFRSVSALPLTKQQGMGLSAVSTATNFNVKSNKLLVNSGRRGLKMLHFD